MKLARDSVVREVGKPVAFTPKGGCPLKRTELQGAKLRYAGAGSIHPKGWVPIETARRGRRRVS